MKEWRLIAAERYETSCLLGAIRKGAKTMTSARDIYMNVCKLIEEYTGSSNISDDEDIRWKLPIVLNQGIKRILQVKPIERFTILRPEDDDEHLGILIYRLPADLYRLRVVIPDGLDYRLIPNGNENFLEVSNHHSETPIRVEYISFHAEADTSIAIDSIENSNFIIELTPECIPVLENFMAMSLTTDTSEMYGNFFEQFNSGMANLARSRSERLVEFMN